MDADELEMKEKLKKYNYSDEEILQIVKERKKREEKKKKAERKNKESDIHQEQQETKVMLKKVFWIMLLPCVIILFIAIASTGAGKKEKVPLSDKLILDCLKGSKMFTAEHLDDAYDEQCKNRSVKILGFITEVDDGELTVNTHDPLASSYSSYDSKEFYVKARRAGRYSKGDKVLISGFFTSTSFFLGGATINRAKVSRVERDESESNAVAIEENYKSIVKNESKRHQAYLACADEFMRTKLGVDCPKPTSALGIGGVINSSGKISHSGLCFFGKQSITFECEYQNGSATVIDFKVH